jgi:NADH:ubiquinone oxidoreductase subunit 6 (subunit J)
MNSSVFRGLAVLAMALMFIGAFMMVDWPSGEIDPTTNADVGRTMFGVSGDSGYGVVVLLIGLLLLVAIMGGTFLAKEEDGQ